MREYIKKNINFDRLSNQEREKKERLLIDQMTSVYSRLIRNEKIKIDPNESL